MSRIFIAKMLIILTIFTACGGETLVQEQEDKDKICPIITLNDASNITLSIGADYAEAGAKASDNMDGDISADIMISGVVDTTKVGYYEVNYSVMDTAGNSISMTRHIHVVDGEIPFIALKGKSTVILNVGDYYQEAGAEAFDKNDGSLSSSIMISGRVNTNKKGTYTIEYGVSDMAGNSASITRDVIVRPKAVTPPSEDTMIIDARRVDASIDLHDATPVGAYYTYEKDDFVTAKERVLELHSSGLQNSFHILGYETDVKYNWWSLPSHQNKHIVSWDSKFDEDFIIYIVLKFTTADGEMKRSDLVYTPSVKGYAYYTKDFMHTSLGKDAKDGKWHHYERDILADLQTFYAGATIDFDNNISGYVNGIAIRGSGRITNLKLSPY